MSKYSALELKIFAKIVMAEGRDSQKTLGLVIETSKRTGLNPEQVCAQIKRFTA